MAFPNIEEISGAFNMSKTLQGKKNLKECVGIGGSL
jgi:hypothetical protein